MLMPTSGRLVSSRTGELSGPCPIKGGRDRFSWWPEKGNWYCRKDCPDCPGKPASMGGRTGWFDDVDRKLLAKVPRPPRPDLPSMKRVDEYYEHGWDDPVLIQYLQSRQIDPQQAIMKYRIGKNCRRLTIPCIVKHDGRHDCYGIKKRWLGTPPEEWIPKYTMEPGSQGASIFNYNVLLDNRKLDYLLIIEGVLDCIMLDQLKIPVIAPFGGGGVWNPAWNRSLNHVGQIIHVADDDAEESDDHPAGRYWAKRRAEVTGRGDIVLPPEGYKDLGEACVGGVDMMKWVNTIRAGGGQRVQV